MIMTNFHKKDRCMTKYSWRVSGSGSITFAWAESRSRSKCISWGRSTSTSRLGGKQVTYYDAYELSQKRKGCM
jgi:4-diphosphocytidyl-2C-methyl-D-erythritol kinase